MGNKQTLPQIPQPLREFTCEICIKPTSISDQKFRNTAGCSHPFCDGCIISYIRVKLQDNIGDIRCPALHCNHKLNPVPCAAIVGPSLFVRWCDVLCEAAALAADHCYCPHRNCNALIVNECGGNVGKSSCPMCKRLFCFRCKRLWHAGFACEELWDSNDVEFATLVERERWSRCPRCRHFVERVAGCNSMSCRCSHPFCDGCIIPYIRVKLEDNIGDIRCPALHCNHKLNPVPCATMAGPSLFVRSCDVLCEAAALAADHCYCPHRNCNALIVNECGGNVGNRVILNVRDCFVFDAKRLWHAGFGCEESPQLWRDRNDVKFVRLVKRKGWSRCPRCRHFVERVGGYSIH